MSISIPQPGLQAQTRLVMRGLLLPCLVIASSAEAAATKNSWRSVDIGDVASI
jgi:hypothetical protein